ncbi:MAG: 50S ribosomal protein L3 [Candidatus Andersenbacteria bacterium CG10_big_fil_rev_8_21_14_0_10_54_11]|uniref:50S ribosomal protein L3 n=1 Tax=Candidatus Andersenbacteria bacterium CG10_big_fil_rev_8_21_14_0_10_54_11 TaxID=1974485 RepID=A0A2M6WYU7_9BACT|nr:MAG: 50S ribosomal protein L3 [Candidatus Andersenbacteria bacterium CG10_big_fil_rev_8_21_14_0_10_54_11]
MKAILGRKIGMSRMFLEDGAAVPVTLICAEPNTVTLRRSEDRDGYAAVQLALPRKGAKAASGEKQTPRQLKSRFAARREFPVELAEDQESVSVETFSVGDVVTVVGTSKGKGFQGVVKRHGFAGGPASHGHRHVLRAPGSIGSRFPQHVRKGKRMAGRMGGERVTVKNLLVLWIDSKKNLLAVKGAVPGPANSIVAVLSSGAVQ